MNHSTSLSLTRRQRQIFTSVFFLAPTFILLGIFMFYSIYSSFNLSFVNWDGITQNREFVGFDNWLTLLKDRSFMLALINNIKVVILSLVVQMPIAMALAFFLSHHHGKFAGLLKVLWALPLMMSSVAVGFLWKNMYDPNFGLFAAILKAFGHKPIAFLGDPKTALYSVIATICWQYIPFYMLYFVAGFSSLPVEVHDAAMIDGATEGQYLFRCAIPMMSRTIKNACILSIVGSLKYFDLILAMTEGGPSGSSNLMATYMYRISFWEVRLSYGSTVASAMFIIITVLSLTLTYLMNKGDNMA